MEHLFVRSVGWTANYAIVAGSAEVLDMCQHHISGLPVIFMVLTASLRGDMSRYTSVNDDVLLSGIVINPEASDNKEAMTTVQLI